MKTIIFLKLSVCVFAFSFFLASEVRAGFKVGIGVTDISPQFESYPVKDRERRRHYAWDPHWDTGIDRLFDYEEPGAFGPDGKPGKAGVDDDVDGVVDNCDRQNCKEYGAQGSDDVKDPNHDNFALFSNPHGTENDGVFQWSALAGYQPYWPLLPNRHAEGILSPLFSRAIALQSDSGETYIIISTDLPGLVWKYINPVKRKIRDLLGVPIKNVIIASNHIHSAPDASGFWSTFSYVHQKGYTDSLKKWIFSSAAKAIDALEPAKMRTITTSHASCYDKETKEIKKLKDCNLPKLSSQDRWDVEGYDEFFMQLDKRDPKVLNPRIVASQFVSTETNKTIGTFVNWHDHPETLGQENLFVASDFIHYIRTYLEEKFGGTSVYFSGTVGCQIGIGGSTRIPKWTEGGKRVYLDGVTDIHGNPVPEFVRDWGIEKTRSIGYEVAWEVEKALNDGPEFKSEISIAIQTAELESPVDNPFHVLTTGSVWSFDIEKPDRMRRYKGRCSNIFGCVPSTISLLTIGDLSMITTPGEMDPSYFLGREEISEEYDKKPKKITFPAMSGFDQYMPGEHHAVLGLGNNYLSYQVHEPDNVGALNFAHPLNYEEMVTISPTFGDDVGNLIMKMLGSSERYSGKSPVKRSLVDDLKVAFSVSTRFLMQRFGKEH